MDQDANQPPYNNGGNNDHGNNDNGNNDNVERRVFTETFVFTGTSGQSILATMQNLMNRLVGGQPPQQQYDPSQPPQSQEGAPMSSNSSGIESGRVPETVGPQASTSQATESGGGALDGDRFMTSNGVVDSVENAGDIMNSPPQQQRTTVEDAIDIDDDEIPDLESLSAQSSEGGESHWPPPPRPMRPLPRNGVRPAPHPQPHAHFHAHTPNGTIDLFTFSVAPGDAMPQPPPHAAGGPTFTFNLGQDVLAGFEAFFLGMPSFEKDREPDVDRAKVLLRGMETVPEGLVRRLERAGGVPGGHGTEENGSAAGCAVCWGPLLDDVEPGEWETALPAKEKTPDQNTDENENERAKEEDEDENELHGRIVALPCAHVYHAECLLPWFSRQTTCPTCRLDVDPDSLTWNPRPPRVPPPHPQQPNMPSNQPPHVNQSEAPQPNAPQPNTPANPGDPNTAADSNAAADPNAAEAARFTRFLNSPFLSWPTRPAGQAPQFAFDALPTRRHTQIQIDPFVLGHMPPVSLGVSPQTLPTALNNPNPPPWTSNQPPSSWTSSDASTWTGDAVPSEPNTSNPAPSSPPPTDAHPHHPPPFPMFVVREGGAPPPPPPHAHHHAHPHPHVHTHGPAPPRRERRKWAPPEPVGKTLRQRVEQKERELGLRCDDAVCGVGPTDEDPVPLADAAAVATVHIRAAYDAQGKECEHTFHPACLVMSARVAGVTGEEEGTDVQVACPACRAEGSLHRAEWEEGVRASAAEMA